MESRRFGKSGLQVTRFGLGCGSGTFVSRADEQEAINIIHHALGLGITYIDTSESAGDGRGETLVGKALKGIRSKVIVSTKCGMDHTHGVTEPCGSRSYIMKAVEGSLKRLDTDYIDLYVMHAPYPDTPIEETLRTLDDLVRAGKVRYIGCSDYTAWQLCEALWTSKMHNLESFVMAELTNNFIMRENEREMVPCCVKYGVGTVIMKALASGFLTGKYQRGKKLPEGTRFTSAPRFAGPKHQNLSRYSKLLSDKNFDKLDKLEAFAQERGHNVGELAIAWLLSKSWVDAVLLGVTSTGQLTQNVVGLDWKLTADEMEQLDKIASLDAWEGFSGVGTAVGIQPQLKQAHR